MANWRNVPELILQQRGVHLASESGLELAGLKERFSSTQPIGIGALIQPKSSLVPSSDQSEDLLASKRAIPVPSPQSIRL